MYILSHTGACYKARFCDSCDYYIFNFNYLFGLVAPFYFIVSCTSLSRFSLDFPTPTPVTITCVETPNLTSFGDGSLDAASVENSGEPPYFRPSCSGTYFYDLRHFTFFWYFLAGSPFFSYYSSRLFIRLIVLMTVLLIVAYLAIVSY